MKRKITDAEAFEAFKLMVLQIGDVYKGGRWRNELRARRMLRKKAKKCKMLKVIKAYKGEKL